MMPQTMEDEPRFSASSKITEALSHGPAIAAVFMRYRMHCIGCTFARFENLRTAAVNHRVDVAEFVEAINRAVDDIVPTEGAQTSDSGSSQPTEEG